MKLKKAKIIYKKEVAEISSYTCPYCGTGYTGAGIRRGVTRFLSDCCHKEIIVERQLEKKEEKRMKPEEIEEIGEYCKSVRSNIKIGMEVSPGFVILLDKTESLLDEVKRLRDVINSVSQSDLISYSVKKELREANDEN